MQTKLRITLNDSEFVALRQHARQAIGRESERAHFVLMSHQGLSAAKVGKLMGAAENTVKCWLRRYQKHGIDGLKDLARSGHPRINRHLTDIVEAQISQPPDCSGYLCTIWTLLLMLLHLRERFGIAISVSTLRRTLSAIRYTWHRPKLSPARRPDPLDAERRMGLARALADKTCHLLAIDECDMCLLATLRSMWQRVGEQARLPTLGQNAKVGVFGAINLTSGALLSLCAMRKRSADFIAFLELVLARYSSGLIRMILDNGSIHHSAETRRWLAVHPRVQLVCLPTYGGHLLNPIEKVWWLLKQHVAANRNFHSTTELVTEVQSWFAAAQPARMLALVNSDVSRRAAHAFPTLPGVNIF